MTLSPGTRLGPHEIAGTIGAGGMGEVSRARDTKLGPDVAVKVLPATLGHDRERIPEGTPLHGEVSVAETRAFLGALIERLLRAAAPEAT